MVKRGTARPAREAGFTHVAELDPWESSTIGHVKITAAPAKHGVPESTYVLESNGLTVFFGGDTMLIPELTEVGRRFPSIDVALLPVNGLIIRPLFYRKVVMDDMRLPSCAEYSTHASQFPRTTRSRPGICGITSCSSTQELLKVSGTRCQDILPRRVSTSWRQANA